MCTCTVVPVKVVSDSRPCPDAHIFVLIQGVKIYDISSKQRITNVLRDNSSLRPDMYPCSLCWKDNTTLIIGWGSSVKVCLFSLNFFLWFVCFFANKYSISFLCMCFRFVLWRSVTLPKWEIYLVAMSRLVNLGLSYLNTYDFDP